MRNKKVLHLLMVGVISLGIILAGAFAWVSFTQTALNIFEGFTNPGVNLHDDFNEPNKDVYVENSGQRPLYVRVKFEEFMDINGTAIDINTGGARVPSDNWHTHSYFGSATESCDELYHDYYEWIMGGKESISGDLNNGWKYYLPAPFSHKALFDIDGYQLRDPLPIAHDHSILKPEEQVRYSGQDYGNDTTAYRNALTQYNAAVIAGDPIPAGTHIESPADTYARIDATLADAFNDTVYDPAGSSPSFATNQEYLDYLYGLIDNAATNGERTGAQNELNRFLRAHTLGYFDLMYEVRDISPSVYKSDRENSQSTGTTFVPATDLVNPEIEFVPIKRTLQTVPIDDSDPNDQRGGVYTIAQWIAAGTPTGPFWIMDTDGWCYWGEILLPSQATGLLLSAVNLSEDNFPMGVWWYGINIKLEAATPDDWNRFRDTAVNPADNMRDLSERAEMVIQAISGDYVFDMQAGSTGANDPVYTFRNNNDNTYQLVTTDGTNVTYDDLFVYTGSVPPAQTGDIFKADEYKIGEFIKKDIPFGKSGAIFKILPWNNESGTSTAIVQASDGKRYIRLAYTGDGVSFDDSTYLPGTDNYHIVWLGVGANGEFDRLTDQAGAGVSGSITRPRLSNNDDILIWTSDDEKPTGNKNHDRYQEDDDSFKVKIGDSFTYDGIDWIIIGMDVANSKTLIISKETIGAVGSTGDPVAVGQITTAIAEYDQTHLAELETALYPSEDGTFEAVLLTIQEAIDYFANNAERSSADGESWWLEDGQVSGTGALSARGTDSIFLRPAIWLDSDKLYDALEAAANP